MKPWIIVIAVIGIIILAVALKQKEPTMSINIYDENHNLVKKTFDIVSTPIPSTFFIDLSISVSNTGDLPLVCNLNSLSPTQLDVSMPRSEKIVQPEESQEWTSNLIPLKDFTGIQRFSVEVLCYSTNGINRVYKDSSDFIDLTIKSMCGDGVCSTDENDIQCPNDCFMGDKSVRFRTSDLTYDSDSAVGLSENCGGILTTYGQYGSYHEQGGYGYCMENMPGNLVCGKPTFVMYLPGGWWNGDLGTGTSLWKATTSSRLCVCTNFVNINNYQYTVYSATDLDKNKISNSPNLINKDMELIC